MKSSHQQNKVLLNLLLDYFPIVYEELKGAINFKIVQIIQAKNEEMNILLTCTLIDSRFSKSNKLINHNLKE